MALNAAYLADTSALSRLAVPDVRQRLQPLLAAGYVGSCAMVDLELLFSARRLTDYERRLEERRALPAVPITPDVMATAIDLQHALARRGQHRIPIPDLIISAAAAHAGLVVLHYDADFERIADAGGAPHEWIVPRGSV